MLIQVFIPFPDNGGINIGAVVGGVVGGVVAVITCTCLLEVV